MISGVQSARTTGIIRGGVDWPDHRRLVRPATALPECSDQLVVGVSSSDIDDVDV